MASRGDASNQRLRRLHFLSALVIGIFVVVHLGNHLYGLAGQQAHIDYMNYARTLYRNRAVEALLLALLAWQAASGLTMLLRGWKQRCGAVARLQALSGLDTDFRFAAAGFFVPPLQFLFAPYYFLAVFCLFAHVGCAVYWRFRPARERLRNGVLGAFLAAGAIASLLIVLSLMGALYPVDIPDTYKATFSL